MTSARRAEHVVVKLVLFVPETNSLAAEIVHRAGDSEKMLEELGRNVFVDVIFQRQLDRDSHQIERKHPHPTGGVALLEASAVGKRIVAIEHADVVEPEKTALKNVVPFGVLAVHPPSEGNQH